MPGAASCCIPIQFPRKVVASLLLQCPLPKLFHQHPNPASSLVSPRHHIHPHWVHKDEQRGGQELRGEKDEQKGRNYIKTISSLKERKREEEEQ